MASMLEQEGRPLKGKGKGRAIPFTGLDRPWGLQEVEGPRFQDNQHMMV